MSISDEAITKLFKIRRTALQMLNDRGYSVLDSEINMARQKFVEKFGENMKKEDLVILSHKIDNPSDQIFVLFIDADKKVGCSIVKDYVIRMKKESVYRAILVAPYPLTPQGQLSISEVSTKFLIEVFQDEELLVNISKHVLVPKHEVLTGKEKQELIAKYGVEEAQLPRIFVNDPIARYFGVRRGQIMKITRPSETAGTYITYRYVV